MNGILCRVAADVRSRICSCCLLWHMRLRSCIYICSIPLQSISWMSMCFMSNSFCIFFFLSFLPCSIVIVCTLCAALCFVYSISLYILLYTPKNGCDYDYDRAAHCTWTLPFLIANWECSAFFVFCLHPFVGGNNGAGKCERFLCV